jgi:hypothetical protein
MEQVETDSLPEWHLRIIRAALKWALERPRPTSGDSANASERLSDQELSPT